MSFRKRPTGDKCVKCLIGNHSQCVAWTCMCTFCVSTVEKQRVKAIRLEEYWNKRNDREQPFDETRAPETFDGRVKPRGLSDDSEDQRDD